MIIHKDDLVQEAYSNWLKQAASECHFLCNRVVSKTTEMTPIEQIVFFVLMAKSCWYTIDIFPQHHIGKYRVDFLVDTYDPRDRKKIIKQSIIECDGHDFHEKTKEQAQRDKKRDRDLQVLGFKIYHFTGSEIWRTGGKCVFEPLGL